jgi:uncharacterized repeat protein (TIGR03803 family)
MYINIKTRQIMKTKHLLLLPLLFIVAILHGQTSFYGVSSKGGASNQGVIFKTDANGANVQNVFDFKYHQPGRNPKSVFTQASNGKIYGTTQFGGTNLCSFPWYQYQKYSGVIFEYDPSTEVYTVLFNFNDTITGCWPNSAPILAPNGKLYGVTPGIGGSSQHYGTVYSFDLATGVYTKIHSFGHGNNDDGENPVGNLLLASDGKIYGVTSDGGFQDKGIIFKVDPTTDTYTKLKDMWVSWSAPKSGQDAKSGLIQAPNGIMYGTTESGGNYPSGYQYAFGNIYKYDPITNVATNLFGFSNDSLGKNPTGAPVLVGTNYLYCVTNQYYQVPGTYNQQPHYYLWRYNIGTGTAMVVDSIANGTFNHDITLNNNNKIILTGKDYNISSAIRIWEFNPTTNTRTLIDTSTNLKYLYRGFMQATNGKYYAGGAFPDGVTSYSTYSNGSFVEYDASNHNITEKFRFSEPIDGILPEGDLFMATNGKLYGTTSKGGLYNKGVVYEFNPANDSFSKLVDLDSLTGYAPKGSIMEASNGKLYGMTSRGGTNSFGAIFEIDTNSWTLTKKADFTSSMHSSSGRLVEAWDGNLYGLTSYNYGTLFQYNINTGAMSTKHTFTYNDGTGPKGSLALANNGKLYGLTFDGGASYYSHGTLFEYDPATNAFAMKKELLNYTGYHADGNTPLMGSDGKMYLLIANGGNGNTEYSGGAINEYIPGATTVSNKASFQVNYTGSKPLGDLMEAANGKLYGYTWTGGANDKGTLFEYNRSTGTITKKFDFNGSNGANPMHGSLTEVGLSNISITSQPSISSNCIGDIAELTVAANHTTLLHYQWYKNGNKIAGATNDTITFNTLSASDAGTYYCKITGGARAIVSNSLTLSPTAKPSVAISNLANSYCADNADINLSATPSGGTFSGTAVSGSVFSPSTAGAGNVDVIYTYTDASGCSNADTVNVTINSLPDASFSGYNSSYCDNSLASTLVPTTTGGTFSGSGISGNTFDPSFYVGGPGLLVVTKIKYEITDANSCYNADSAMVTIYHAPIVNISGLDTIYCENATIDTLVTTPNGGTVTAGTFLNGNIFSPSNASIGYNYIYYSYTNSNNCTNSDTIKIKINAAPDASFSGLAATYCNNGQASVLSPTVSGGTFTGTTSGSTFDPSQITIPTNVLSVTKAITYSLTNTDGCTDSTTQSTIVYPLPTVNFGTLVPSICNNAVPIILNLGTPSGGTYSGNGVQGIAFTPADAAIGNDTLVYSYTNTNNCTNTDTAVIEVLQSPDFTLGDDSSICINHVITLATKLGSGYVYLWSDGSTDSTLTIDASTLGTGTFTYSVTVTNQANNCVESDDIIITVNPCTGINTSLSENNNIKVYPNPSKGIFNINTSIAFESLEVYSTDGRLIYSEVLKGKGINFKLDLTNQSKGVYYLLLSNGKTIERKKLIVE